MELRKIKQTKKRKGQADFISLFFVLAVLFGVAIFAIILYNAYNDNIKDNLNNALTASTPVDENANVTEILGDTSSGILMINSLFPLLLVGLFAFGLVMAMMGKSHPVFFFIGLIMLAVSIILAVVFSNVYTSISETDNFIDTTHEFGVVNFVMNNLPLVIFILFIAIAAIMYGMRGGGTPKGGSY